MDYFDLILNLVCFSLLFAFWPSGLLNQQQQTQHDRHEGSRHMHHPSSDHTRFASPRSAAFAETPTSHLVVPTITLTPDRAADRPRHKRKSVSFSLSSMTEIIPKRNENVEAHKKRPPTPFFSGPVSPSAQSDELIVLSAPATPLLQNIEAMDPMGVQKKWLMA